MKNGFLEQGDGRGAYFVQAAHQPDIAVTLGTLHAPPRAHFIIWL